MMEQCLLSLRGLHDRLRFMGPDMATISLLVLLDQMRMPAGYLTTVALRQSGQAITNLLQSVLHCLSQQLVIHRPCISRYRSAR